MIIFTKRKYYSLGIASEVLLDNIQLFCPNNKLLIIGMSPTGLFQGVLQNLKQLGITPDVVELNEQHTEWIRMAQDLKVYNMDAKDFKEYDNYDCVYWAEGPEHVTNETFNIINGKIKCNFIIECPWGEAPEHTGIVGMNHINAWEPEQLNELGFNVIHSTDIYYPNMKPLICGFKIMNVKNRKVKK